MKKVLIKIYMKILYSFKISVHPKPNRREIIDLQYRNRSYKYIKYTKFNFAEMKSNFFCTSYNNLSTPLTLSRSIHCTQ